MCGTAAVDLARVCPCDEGERMEALSFPFAF